MMPWAKEEILFEWNCPKGISEALAKARIRRVFVFYPRVLFVIAIIWTLIYFTCDYLFPQNSGINLEKLFIAGLVFPIAVLPLEYLVALTGKFSRIKYRVTPNSVYIGNQIIIRWKNIVGYKIFDYEDLKEFSGVRLFFHKCRHYRTIYLPQSEQAAEIIKYISQRVPLIEDLPPGYEIIKLSTGQKFFLYVFTFAYTVILSLYIVFYEAYWLSKFYLVVLVLGPGSIYFPLVFGKRFFKNHRLRSYTFLCNIIAWFLTMLLTSFLWVYHLKQTIPDW